MKVIGYVRVSSEGQVADGDSTEVQKEKISQWCVLYGHELKDLYVDARISGKRADNRPWLSEALDCAHKEKDNDGDRSHNGIQAARILND